MALDCKNLRRENSFIMCPFLKVGIVHLIGCRGCVCIIGGSPIIMRFTSGIVLFTTRGLVQKVTPRVSENSYREPVWELRPWCLCRDSNIQQYLPHLECRLSCTTASEHWNSCFNTCPQSFRTQRFLSNAMVFTPRTHRCQVLKRFICEADASVGCRCPVLKMY